MSESKRRKISIVYYSKSGRTAMMAGAIAKGIETVPGVEAHQFDLEHLDEACLRESCAVVVGTPTYHANPCWQIKKWLDESGKYHLGGKLGAAFATADYAQGGADVAISTILTHLMVNGMLVYSGGASLGQPYIHLGAVALRDTVERDKQLFETFGQRIAEKVQQLGDYFD